MSQKRKQGARVDAMPRTKLVQHLTQPEEDGRALLRRMDAWTESLRPESEEQAFLCRELALTEWRLERLRRIENGILWWAIDDIRDRNADAAKYGHPTGEPEMNPEDFTTLTMGRAFKFASARQDLMVRLSRIESALTRRMYKALELALKLRSAPKPAK